MSRKNVPQVILLQAVVHQWNLIHLQCFYQLSQLHQLEYGPRQKDIWVKSINQAALTSNLWILLVKIQAEEFKLRNDISNGFVAQASSHMTNLKTVIIGVMPTLLSSFPTSGQHVYRY